MDTNQAKVVELLREVHLIDLVGIITANRRRPMIEDTDVIRRLLAEFTDLDPSSTGTRYGLRKDFATYSLGTVREVSLQKLRGLLVKLSHDLTAIMTRFQYVKEPWWDEDLHEEWTRDYLSHSANGEGAEGLVE